MRPASRFDLDAIEFRVVRELLVERLVTTLGRPLVDALAPFGSAEDANAALDEAAALAAAAAHGERPPVSGAVEVRSWLGGFFDGVHQPVTRDLAELKRLLRAASRCRAWLIGRSGSAVLAATGGRIPAVDDVAEELERVVDDRGEVLDSASIRLAELRREIDAADAGVRVVVARVLADERVRRCLQTPEAAWRHGRPVLQVRAELRGNVPGVLHDRSASGATVFIEPEAVIDAANRLADARADEHREIQVVVTDVCRALRRLRTEITAAVACMAALDLAMARARLIHEDGWCAVPIVTGGTLCLRRALHPILSRAATSRGRREELVPLDLTLGEAQRMLVVTGPNTGGKTVVLKSVGLLAAMALAGVPIPAAEGSGIPLYDGLFVDIGDEQAIQQSLSTFSSHVVRIARCLDAATSRSLILIDELGSGTDPDEGGALGTAVLEAIERIGATTVVTTHIGRLKGFAHAHPAAINGAMAFDGASLLPLYRLDVGIPGFSHALDVAGRVGMPAAIVTRARELLGTKDVRLEEVIERVESARREAEAGRRRVEQLEQDARAAGRAADERRAELDKRRAWLEEEADALVDSRLRAVRERLDGALKQLAGVPRPFDEVVRELRDTVNRPLEQGPLRRRRLAFLAGVKKDDVVYLPRLARRCTVRKIDRVREILSIEVGTMRLEVPFEDVSWFVPLDA
ncbi:MAG: hypothetical protein HZB39_06670 [Planctomycetes bacterium]|nr:hypothetical protein [Planctomycetota bacterium]